MIFAANDVRDAHLDVVHDVDEMEHRLAVGAHDDETRIGLLAIGEFADDVAGDHVGDRHRLAGHAELDRALVLVRQILVEQFLNSALVNLAALRLKIRAAIALALLHGAARHRPFVPVKAEPAQAVEDHIDRLAAVAGVVGVLHAQHKRAAGVPGIKPVEQRRASAANVKIARRAGSKSNSNSHKKPARTLPASQPPGKLGGIMVWRSRLGCGRLE